MSSTSPWVSVFLMGVAGYAAASLPAAQHERVDPAPLVRTVERSRALTLEGVVLGPNGNALAGAMVVSSAGGKALTDPSGAYRLEVVVPHGVARLQVTAVESGGRSSLASASVALTGASRRIPVEPLVLIGGTSCSPTWLPTFGGAPGTDSEIRAVAVHDDGGGAALYVAGSFSTAGGVEAAGIARWDGTSWSALTSAMTTARALAVYDDGSGPALYAGGSAFDPTDRILKWDGTSWSALGAGIDGGSLPTVFALAVHDDGSGPALHVGGEFTSAGGMTANRIAKWDGSGWSSLGTGLTGSVGGFNPVVRALAVHDDGTGPALFVGGLFTRAGGAPASRIARWSGTAWSALGSGTDGTVRALASYDDGGGSALYAGGEFTLAGGAPASHVASWDGASWSAVGSGTDGNVHVFRVWDDGSGPALHAGGAFATAGGVSAHGIARWNGLAWSDLAGGTTTSTSTQVPVSAMAVYEDGNGTALFAAGNLASAGGVPANRIARWNGASWSALGNGVNAIVGALTVFDDGGGPALHAGGAFTTAGGVAVSRIARWDGAGWSPLGSGVDTDGTFDPGDVIVRALAVHDDGNGPALFAGGRFELAGGAPASHVARWDGTGWSPLGSGVDGASLGQHGIAALASFDDGSGPALYAGGWFTSAGGAPASRIARWDGASWTPLGAGVDFGGRAVLALAGFDDGTGPALYAGGLFLEAGGSPASCIARWDGTTWSSLGSGLTVQFFGDPSARALLVHDDGGGPALFVGGGFDFAGGVEAHGIARWQSSGWSAVGVLQGASVNALASFDDGQGPGLFAAGTFGEPLLGKWDGADWDPIEGPLVQYQGPSCLHAHDDGGGPALFVGGSAIASADSYLSKWGFPADIDPPALDCPASVDVLDAFGSPSGEVVSFSVTASDCRDPAPSVVCVPPSGSFFPRGTTLVTCTATDASGNESVCQFPVTVLPKARPR